MVNANRWMTCLVNDSWIAEIFGLKDWHLKRKKREPKGPARDVYRGRSASFGCRPRKCHLRTKMKKSKLC